MSLSSVIRLVVSVLACLAAGGIGSLFTYKAIPTWYRALKKPRYTPPNWAFGPIWTTLYILMGVSVFLVWNKGLTVYGATVAFTLFFIPEGSSYLLGVLNSTTGRFFLSQICPKIRGGFMRFKSIYMEQIPIPPAGGPAFRRIEELVEEIGAAKSRDISADVSVREREIDHLMYRLYGLTDAEIALIEKR